MNAWPALFAGRATGALLSVLAGGVLVFVLMRLGPGDPAVFVLGDFATPDAVRAFHAEHHLDEALTTQLLRWVAGLLHGDFGLSVSLYRGISIASLLRERLPNTVFVGTFALLISLSMSLVLGSIAALRRGRAADTLITAASVLGISMPDFWLGYVLVLLFALNLHWLPAYGFTSPMQSLGRAFVTGLLPALAIAAPLAAGFTRILRVSLLDTLGRDYVRMGRSIGLHPAFLFVQFALRNALIPFVTIVGLQVRFLLGGVVVIEKIFGVPGVGSLMVDAIFARDYLLVQACAVTFLVVVVVSNFLVDVACTLLDPRRGG